VLPAIGFAGAAVGIVRARLVVWSATLAYSMLFTLLVAWGLPG
jgi:hypothetical protein